MNNIKEWKDDYISGAKRCNINRSDWCGDWFVGTGKEVDVEDEDWIDRC